MYDCNSCGYTGSQRLDEDEECFKCDSKDIIVREYL